MFNLSKRDADVAIRPANDPPETLVGRRIAKIAFAVYASPHYLAKHRKSDGLAAHDWVGPGRQSFRHFSRTMDACESCPRARSRFEPIHFSGLRQAAQAGLGLAPLPCYLGDTSPDLVCVHPAHTGDGDGACGS